MKIYKKNKHPRRCKGEEFSETVIVQEKDGFLNLGYWNFDIKKWLFHSDTLKDMDDVDFVWCYPPKELRNGSRKIREREIL